MKLISRKDAKTQGLLFYFTGKPCKRGHVLERYVSTRVCVNCRYKQVSEWTKNNSQKHRENVRKWNTKNPEKHAAMVMKRCAEKLKRTPKWADFKLIKKFYTEAAKLTKETGIEHQVDHIIPLQGKMVSGLHVEYNLQVITKKENLLKRNNFIDV